MKSLLIIKSSIAGDHSQSGKLADGYKTTWLANNPGGTVTVRDLSVTPVKSLDGATIGAFYTPVDQLTADQKKLLVESDTLLAEIKAHDEIVITAPMYNFSVPGLLKDYFDSIARVGVSFQYTENGPEGLLTGKKVIVVSTRGGKYAGTAADVQTPFVHQFLGFLGLNITAFVYAEGMAGGEEAAAAAIASAKEQFAAIA